MQIVVLSFGFHHGLIEADYVFDLRFLPNPFWVPDLKPLPDSWQERTCTIFIKN